MYLLIKLYGEPEIVRKLSPTESLDVEHHAKRYAKACDIELDTDKPTHTGMGADVDITIQPTKKPGAVHVWNSKGFYFLETE